MPRTLLALLGLIVLSPPAEARGGGAQHVARIELADEVITPITAPSTITGAPDIPSQFTCVFWSSWSCMAVAEASLSTLVTDPLSPKTCVWKIG